MHVDCPECNTPVTAEGVNIAKTIAVCKHCDNIFDFEDQFPTTPGQLAVVEKEPDTKLRLKEEIFHIPPGIEVLKIESMLEIMINWRRSGKYFTLFFGVFWNLFIIFFSFMAFFSGGIGAEGIIIFLFMLPFYGVGAYLLYSGIGQLFNTTYVTVYGENLSIEHKPVNFLIQKDRHFSKEEIQQLYVKRYSIGSTNGQPVYAYSVDLVLKNGKRYPLVKNLRSLEAARFIEQEVEEYLNIEDKIVRGEWQGDILKR